MKKEIIRFCVLIALVFIQLELRGQTWQWVKEENAGSEAYGVACDNAGNGFLAGVGAGTAIIGTFTASGGGQNGILAKYDGNGNALWAQFIPGTFAYNVACDASGNSILCGYFF